MQTNDVYLNLVENIRSSPPSCQVEREREGTLFEQKTTPAAGHFRGNLFRNDTQETRGVEQVTSSFGSVVAALAATRMQLSCAAVNVAVKWTNDRVIIYGNDRNKLSFPRREG